MKERKIDRAGVVSLVMCYVLWGFQPLYWAFISDVDPYTILAFRIIMAAVFSVLLLALQHRTGELRALFRNRSIMKFMLPAVIFLLVDWTVFIVVVNAGHVLDASLGYYFNPLLLFAVGVIVYREKSTKLQVAALGIACVGVAVSTLAFGGFPLISVVIAVNWAVYSSLKRNIRVDGVLSIAAETLLLTPFALVFLLLFRAGDIAGLDLRQIGFLLGGGVVTALPMFLYSNCVSKFSLIVMCFAQYLSPTFNLICGLLTGESFTKCQIVSFLFFIAAIVVSSAGELKRLRSNAAGT